MVPASQLGGMPARRDVYASYRPVNSYQGFPGRVAGNRHSAGPLPFETVAIDAATGILYRHKGGAFNGNSAFDRLRRNTDNKLVFVLDRNGPAGLFAAGRDIIRQAELKGLTQAQKDNVRSALREYLIEIKQPLRPKAQRVTVEAYRYAAE